MKEKIRVYTDGACSGNPGPGGWGAVIFFKAGKQEISGYEKLTTNNRMELKAVLESLSLVEKLGHTMISVYSDSAYVVNAINNNWIRKWCNNGWQTASNNDVKNKDLWINMIKILRNKSLCISMVKVKGHSNNINNDRCDEIARKEIKEHNHSNTKLNLMNLKN